MRTLDDLVRSGKVRFATSACRTTTPANFEVFGKILLPILGELGVDAGRPDVIAVHNIRG